MPLPGQPRGINGLDEENTTKTLLVFGRSLPIVEQVGDGAKSTVYLCHNPDQLLRSMPPTLAVKRMYFDVTDVEDAHKEMDLLANLRHPNIIQYYDAEVARTEGRMCVSLVMEFCPNSLTRIMSLSQKRGQRLPEKTILQYVDNVGSALSFLHAKNPPIAHRDLKAENILIGSDGVGKLCDFGSATTIAYHCQTRQEVQLAVTDIERHTTLSYRAPEMVDPWQRHRIDEAVDVWSLGVLIYYMMTFTFPFPGETSLAILNGTLEFPGWLPAHYSKDLMELVRRCLTKDVSKRPTIHEVGAYLQSTFGLGNSFVARSEDWEPQVVRESHRASEHTFEELQPSAVPRGKPDLFSMLQWQPTSGAAAAPGQTAHSQPVASVASSVPQQPPMSAATAKALDDLFEQAWSTPNEEQTMKPPSKKSDALDNLFGDASAAVPSATQQQQQSRAPTFESLF